MNIIGDFFVNILGERCPNFILRANPDAALSLARGVFEFFGHWLNINIIEFFNIWPKSPNSGAAGADMV